MLTALSLLAACSSVPVGSDIPVSTTGDDAAPPREVAAADATATTFSVTLPSGLDGFVELRPYRTDDTGVTWTGMALQTEAITSDAMTLTLPAAPPARDFIGDDDGSVVYAVALRAADADGEPGIYTGLADVQIVYAGQSPPSGASAGWNLALHYGESDASWLTFSEGAIFGENLVAQETLTLGGYSAQEVTPGTHLTLADSSESGALSVYDTPIVPDWSVALSGPPPTTALDPSDAYDGTFLSLYAYLDDDGDDVRTTEPVVAQVCLDDQITVVSWFAYAFDLETALTMKDLRVGGGWDLLADSPNGLQPVPSNRYTDLLLATSCD